MFLINNVILFITKLYSTKLYTKYYLKNDDYISYIINKNRNSTYNLMNNTINNYRVKNNGFMIYNDDFPTLPYNKK